MVDQQPIQDPMIPNGTTKELTGVQKLEAVRGDIFLEWTHVDVAIAGVVRRAKELPEFQSAAQEAGVKAERPHYEEPWTVSFAIGDVNYVLSHDDVYRPSNHYLTERAIVERTEAGSTNRAILCTIQGLKHTDEKVHLGPRAELSIGDSEPVTGVDALIGLTDAFPELGLVWN